MKSFPDSDQDLLSQWLDDGIESAFSEIVQRYAGLVHQAARRNTKDEELAAEVVQNTFVTLARSASKLRGYRTLGGWLLRTAFYQASNLRRSSAREAERRARLTQLTITPDKDTSIDSWDQVRADLDDALLCLNQLDRDILILRFYRDLKPKEIAGVLGMSLDACHKRISRATEKLRDRMFKKGHHRAGASCLAGLMVFSRDAHVAVDLVPLLASRAIASAASIGLQPITLLPFTLMTKYTIITGSVIVLMIGVAIYTTQERRRDPLKEALVTSPSSMGCVDTIASLSSKKERPAQKKSDFAQLVQIYGEDRVKLAHQATVDFFKFSSLAEGNEMLINHNLEAVNQVGLIPQSLEPPSYLNPELLSAEQNEVVREMQKKWFEEQKANEVTGQELDKNTAVIMEQLLAADAYAAGEISKDDFEIVRSRYSNSKLFRKLNVEVPVPGGMPFQKGYADRYEKLLDGKALEEFKKDRTEWEMMRERSLENFKSLRLEDVVKRMPSKLKIAEANQMILEAAIEMEN